MKRIQLFTFIVLLLISSASQVMAQSVPDYLPEIRTEIYDSAAIGKGGIFLSNYRELGMNFQGDPEFNSSIMVLNNDGTPLFSKNIGATLGTGLVDFKMHPNGMMSYPKVLKNYLWTGGGEVIHMVMDHSFNMVDSFQMKNGYVAETHDFRILPNGHTLLMGYYLVPIDMSKRVEGGQPNALVDGAVIQELDHDKNVVFQWRTWDYLSFDMVPWAMVPGNTQQIINVFHLNAISMDHDGNLLLGTPGMGLKVSRQTGEIMWLLGGVFNQFTFTNVSPLEGMGDLGGHTFHRLENGHILVYDNSPFPWQPGANEISAEAVEYEIDEVNKTAELVWKYTPSILIPGWHAGSAQRLPNGNTVIGWGGPPAEETSLVFSEITPDSTRVMDVFFEGDKVESYRAFRFQIDDGIPEVEVTIAELAPGNTYDFQEGDTVHTGVSIKLESYSGSGYNELTVGKHLYAPVQCEFPGKAPRLIAKRMVCTGYNLKNMKGQIRFDIDEWGIKNPDEAIVYYREFEGQGLFIPLETDYNHVTRQVRGRTNNLGEFIIAYPDLESLVFSPSLLLPLDSAKINQEVALRFSWNPKGFINEYDLEIATDAGFGDIVVSEPSLKEALFAWMDFDENATYYWRVKSRNDAGDSEWSATHMFSSTTPYLEVVSPNGDEVITRGLDHYIHWKGNTLDSVKLELYLDNELVTVIDTVRTAMPDRMFYQWEFPTSLDSACGYHIKISSISDSLVRDCSDFTFAVNDSSCTNHEVPDITLHAPGAAEIGEAGNPYQLTLAPNPTHGILRINYTLEEAQKVEAAVYSLSGELMKMFFIESQNSGQNESTMDLSELPGGMYLIKISFDQHYMNRKIVIQ